MNPTLTLRSFGYWAYQYKRTWRGTFASGVLGPVLFLAAMGVGLGSLVDHRTGSATHLGGVGYLQFLAPGLLAATAVQTAAMESTWPVMASIKWVRTYHAMLATPLGVLDVLFGHLLWMAARVTIGCAAYLAVAAAFGAVASPYGLLAVPVGTLLGVATAAPIAAFASTQDTDAAGGIAAINRFVIMPMFLFSGTFFPIGQLPAGIRWLAWVTPLWHGVALCRAAALGRDPGALALAGHLGYLLALTGLGTYAAVVCYRRRLAI